jgi:hypothetical protein
MGATADRLLGLVDSEDRYDIPFEELREAQVEAVDERLRERRAAIRLLGHRADEAGVTAVRSREEVVPLLFPHTAYKSYPESFLSGGRWDRLGRWLDTVATHRVPRLDPAAIGDVDDWIDALAAGGHFVSCSSGTTGKSAMLVASAADMAWCRKEAVRAYSWGSGVQPLRDRRMISTGAVAHVPRNRATGEAYAEALQDPAAERFANPIPPITVGGLTRMVVLRKAIADGTATPDDIRRFEETSAERAKAVEASVGVVASAAIAARKEKLHVSGLWASLYEVAKEVRARGYAARDFHPENSIYVGGGLKRAVLPADHREYVYETFNIAPERNYQNYSMQELHSGNPRCRAGGRYHVPPWVVPLVLDRDGSTLLPSEGEVEGRAAFVDLSIDGRWGGVITGDRVAIDFGPCRCGSRGPSVRDAVVRYADIAGDDKIGCAGSVDAYVRGIG